MDCDDAILGWIYQHERPNWKPLQAALGSELVSWFMWMFEIELVTGPRLHAYKHSTTRRYLFLDASGQAYDDRGDGRYSQRSLSVAIIRGFAGWERCSPAERDLAALRLAVRRARQAATSVVSRHY